MKNVLVCGVGNSSNLGDRIIAETLNVILEKVNDEISIINFDFTNGLVRNTSMISKIKLNSNSFIKRIIPNTLRKIKVKFIYRKNKELKRELDKYIYQSDIIIIGGGQLLIDNNLNFAIGINNIITRAKKYSKPVVFAFVGGRGPWSNKAEKLILNALEYSKYISVRDSITKKFLLNYNIELDEKIIVTSDPALYVNELLGLQSNLLKNSVNKQIGLGIMDPYEFKKINKKFIDRETCAKWWVSLIKSLIRLGYEVNIFTNGAPTDNAFVEFFIKPKVKNINGVYFSNYPSNYKELLNIISQPIAVVAQRLHACLPSISLGKHTYGLKWDTKLQSIFNELGLKDYLIDFNNEPNELAEKLNTKLLKSSTLDFIILKNIAEKKKEMLEFVRSGFT